MAAEHFQDSKKAPPDRGASSFVYPATSDNLVFFADILKNGGIVAIPTETVYGLAAIATDAEACRTIFQIKGRPLIDPLIVHVASLNMAADLALLPAEIKLLAEAFWPGPLTMVLPKTPAVPDIVTAGKRTVALRMPNHSVTQVLLEQIGMPLAAPSANPFGYVSPSRPEHVAASFAQQVPYIIDGGPCEIGLESTILDLSGSGPARILRPGAISQEAIAGVLKRKVHLPDSLERDAAEAATIAPGSFPSHYSPKARMDLFERGTTPVVVQGTAAVFLQRPNERSPGNVFWLSEDGDPRTIGHNLFALLRKLDGAGYTRIHCEVPDTDSPGLWPAIRDRLLRAASPK